MILNDTAIKRLSREQGMIAPFTDETVRVLDERAIISYGLAGHGYDLRLSPREFRKFIPVKGAVDPRNPDPNMTTPLLLEHDDQGSFFTIPPQSPSAVRMYAGEGVVHLFFLEGATAEHPYQSSRYQGQPESVVMGGV